MKLISETTVSRYRIVDRVDQWSKMMQVNWGTSRRYRHTPDLLSFWGWLGLSDRVEIEWEAEWFPVKVMPDADI
jgi:hypothetical protein